MHGWRSRAGEAGSRSRRNRPAHRGSRATPARRPGWRARRRARVRARPRPGSPEIRPQQGDDPGSPKGGRGQLRRAPPPGCAGPHRTRSSARPTTSISAPTQCAQIQTGVRRASICSPAGPAGTAAGGGLLADSLGGLVPQQGLVAGLQQVRGRRVGQQELLAQRHRAGSPIPAARRRMPRTPGVPVPRPAPRTALDLPDQVQQGGQQQAVRVGGWAGQVESRPRCAGTAAFGSGPQARRPAAAAARRSARPRGSAPGPAPPAWCRSRSCRPRPRRAGNPPQSSPPTAGAAPSGHRPSGRPPWRRGRPAPRSRGCRPAAGRTGRAPARRPGRVTAPRPSGPRERDGHPVRLDGRRQAAAPGLAVQALTVSVGRYRRGGPIARRARREAAPAAITHRVERHRGPRPPRRGQNAAILQDRRPRGLCQSDTVTALVRPR